MGNLENKVAIVIGGGAGNGAALSAESAGVATVWDAATGEKAATKQTAAGTDAAFFQCDVSDTADVERSNVDEITFETTAA